MAEREPCRVCGEWYCQDEVACRQEIYAALATTRERLAHVTQCLRTVLRGQEAMAQGTVDWAWWHDSCPELLEEG